MLQSGLIKSSLDYYVTDHLGTVDGKVYGSAFDATAQIGLQIVESVPRSIGASHIHGLEIVMFSVNAAGAVHTGHNIDESQSTSIFAGISDFDGLTYATNIDEAVSSKVSRQFSSRMKARCSAYAHSLRNSPNSQWKKQGFEIYTGYGTRTLVAGAAATSIASSPVGFCHVSYSGYNADMATALSNLVSAALTSSAHLSNHTLTATDFAWGITS